MPLLKIHQNLIATNCTCIGYSIVANNITMRNPDDNIENDVSQRASSQLDSQQGDFPVMGSDSGGHINYEILPIQELRIRAEKLNVPNWEELNKQKLIDAIRNYAAKTDL